MSRNLTLRTLAPTRQSDLGLLSDDWLAGHVKGPEPEPTRRKRAVIYPRYSTLLQDPNSVERQIDACAKYLDRIDADLVEVGDRFADRAKSGAYVVTRDGLNELLVGVARGLYDIVVVEDADRLSRDLGHLGDLYRTIQHHGAELHAAMRGKLGLAEIAMYGFLSEEQRVQLKIRSRAGCKQAAAQGRAPKGSIYGYAPGPEGRGFLVLHEDHAAIVHLIFTMADEGVPIRAIARHLNRENIPSPYGKEWSAAALRGSAKDRSGLLRNNRYKGVLVYNRTETRRHPTTGKRTLVPRPASEWVVVAVPEWQIVDPELWARVQKRLGATDTVAAPRRSKTHESLFPRQMYCSCGARMTSVVKHAAQGRRLQCSSFVEKGRCTIGHSVGQAYVERNAVRMIRDQIICEKAVESFDAEYRRECARIHDETERKRKTLSAEIAALDGKIERTWDDRAMRGFSIDRIASWRTDWETELRKKREELARLPRTDRIPRPDPARASTLREAFTDLVDRIPSPLEGREDQTLLAALRALVSKIELVFAPGGRGYTLRIAGRLDGILDAAGRAADVVPVPRPIEKTFGPTEWGRMADPDKRAKLVSLAESGAHGLTEDDWRLVGHLFLELDLRAVKPKDVVDAGLFHLRTKAPMSKLPNRYGHFQTVRQALIRMVQAGIWDDAMRLLQAEASEAVRGLDLSIFERWKEAA